jgi:TolC family type I secretion outer membrane protein
MNIKPLVSLRRQAAGRKLTLAVALVFSAACAPAWSLDLLQAYEAAMQEDASIRATRAATDARRERIPQARAQLLPNLSASVSRNRNELQRTTPDFLNRPVTSDTRYGSSSDALTLRQPIFRPFQIADYRQAQAQVDDANAILERELQNVAVRVSGAYFEALLTAEQLALVIAQKTAYTTQLDAARKRLTAGAGTRTDIDEAQAALDLNLAQELEARQNVAFTRRQLQALVNRPVDVLAELDTQKLRLIQPAPNLVEDWINRAEGSSPEIQSLKAQFEAARYEVDKAQAGHFPTLDVIAQWSRNDSDSVTNVTSSYTNKLIGLQLNVPIFAGGQVNSQVRQALAEQERVAQALEGLRRDLGVRIHREFRGVTEGVLRVRALEQAVRSTEQVVLSNRRSYEAGSRTLVDILNAEQQKVAAQRDLAQARFVYLISRVRLQALAGGPKTEVIDQINGWLKP